MIIDGGREHVIQQDENERDLINVVIKIDSKELAKAPENSQQQLLIDEHQ